MKLSSVLLFGDARAQSDDFEEKLDVADERFFGFGSVASSGSSFAGFGSAAAGAILGASASVGGWFGGGSPAEIAAEIVDETTAEDTTTTSYYETYTSTTTTSTTTTSTTWEPTSTFYSTTSPGWADGTADDPWAESDLAPWYFGTETCKALVEEKTKPEADEDC